MRPSTPCCRWVRSPRLRRLHPRRHAAPALGTCHPGRRALSQRDPCVPSSLSHRQSTCWGAGGLGSGSCSGLPAGVAVVASLLTRGVSGTWAVSCVHTRLRWGRVPQCSELLLPERALAGAASLARAWGRPSALLVGSWRVVRPLTEEVYPPHLGSQSMTAAWG